ncbi:MAG: extracellular solute-binding protein [Oscillospiraceae bacterium]|nr:extracellular solute-binding protein [Oscillospiraceae bacterium]
MVKKIKKLNTILLFLLLACIIIFSAWISSGCAKSNSDAKNADNTENTTTANSGETNIDSTVSDQTTTVARIDPGLPQEDYNGYEFRILSRGPSYNVHWYAKDIYAEQENGDPINDAVYLRNKTIEDKYNIKIVNLPENGDLTPRASKSIKAGDDAFDLMCHGLSQITTLMTGGYLYDLKTFPYLDLTKPWWDQKAAEQLTMDGRLFATVSNYLITDKDATWILMFNKQVQKDYNLDDPYQLVKDGTWTMGKMLDMIKAVAKDLNGDGVMDQTDQWGLVSQYRNAMAFYNGAGEYIAKVNQSTGEPELTMFSQRAVDICDKILQLQSDKQITINADDYASKYPNDTVWDGMQLVVFNTNRAMFYYAGMNRVTLLRDMATDFGIIPPPKYDEQQDGYYPSVEVGCTSSVAIPVTVTDKDRTGIILEALTAESQYTLLPAYYDISLKTKFARDNESQEMLDLIFASRLYDIAQVYNWGNVTDFFNSLNKGTNTMASYWDKNEAKITTAMEKTIAQFDQIQQ